MSIQNVTILAYLLSTSLILNAFQEKENIIDDLVYQGLNDISNESNLLLIKYMGDFIL